jgi:hypothetical protein
MTKPMSEELTRERIDINNFHNITALRPYHGSVTVSWVCDP